MYGRRGVGIAVPARSADRSPHPHLHLLLDVWGRIREVGHVEERCLLACLHHLEQLPDRGIDGRFEHRARQVSRIVLLVLVVQLGRDHDFPARVCQGGGFPERNGRENLGPRSPHRAIHADVGGFPGARQGRGQAAARHGEEPINERLLVPDHDVLRRHQRNGLHPLQVHPESERPQDLVGRPRRELLRGRVERHDWLGRRRNLGVVHRVRCALRMGYLEEPGALS
mmetsp:Transcript_77141/g.249745  ORF Transcript_77141/g.249745 Transcript_77141/m.249745 type:complete len:226 (+) Transcript_77141:2162-2839(+)